MHKTIAECCLCASKGVLTDGQEIYPHRPDLLHKTFFKCPACPGVYVGCHPGTVEPLGLMADKKLRDLKMKAHAMFDPWWRSKKMKRHHCYGRLAKEMNIPRSECHFGMFRAHQLIEAMSLIEKWEE